MWREATVTITLAPSVSSLYHGPAPERRSAGCLPHCSRNPPARRRGFGRLSRRARRARSGGSGSGGGGLLDFAARRPERVAHALGGGGVGVRVDHPAADEQA